MQKQNGGLVYKYANRKDIRNHLVTEVEEQLGGGEAGFGVYVIQPHIDEGTTFKLNSAGCSMEYQLPEPVPGRQYTFMIGVATANIIIRTMDTDVELADSTGAYVTMTPPGHTMKAIINAGDAVGEMITLRCIRGNYKDNDNNDIPGIWACINAIGEWNFIGTYVP